MFNRLECSIYFDDPLCILYTGTARSGGISISRIKTHSTQRQYRTSAFSCFIVKLFSVMTYLTPKSPILISYAYRTLRDELHLMSLYKSPLWERCKAYRKIDITN